MNRVALLLFPLFFKLTSGVYVSDIAVILDSMFRRQAYQRVLMMSVMGAFLIFATLSMIGVLRGQGELLIESFNYPLKIILLFLYVTYLSRIDYSRRTIGVFIFLLSVPIIISVTGYFVPLVYDHVVTLWSTDRHAAYRYGGIFGADVNSYGMYATLVLWLSVYAYYKKHIGPVILIIAASGALASILISGMRAGVMVLIGLLMAWLALNVKKISRRTFMLIVLLLAFVMLSLYGLYEKSPDVFAILVDRYSIDRFYLDIGLGGDSGNLFTAMQYFQSVVVREMTMIDMIIGYDPGVRYVDSLYIEMFVKYGAFGVITISIGALLLYRMAKFHRFFSYQFVFVLLISLKGVFVLANYFMFIFVFWYFLKKWECSDNGCGWATFNHRRFVQTERGIA